MKARNPCPKCVEKHLAQAVILMQEAENGYPEHKLLAVGHLAEAEAECDDPKWREWFRAIRHQIQEIDSGDNDLVLEEVLFEYGNVGAKTPLYYLNDKITSDDSGVPLDSFGWMELVPGHIVNSGYYVVQDDEDYYYVCTTDGITFKAVNNGIKISNVARVAWLRELDSTFVRVRNDSQGFERYYITSKCRHVFGTKLINVDDLAWNVKASLGTNGSMVLVKTVGDNYTIGKWDENVIRTENGVQVLNIISWAPLDEY